MIDKITYFPFEDDIIEISEWGGDSIVCQYTLKKAWIMLQLYRNCDPPNKTYSKDAKHNKFIFTCIYMHNKLGK